LRAGVFAVDADRPDSTYGPYPDRSTIFLAGGTVEMFAVVELAEVVDEPAQTFCRVARRTPSCRSEAA